MIEIKRDDEGLHCRYGVKHGDKMDFYPCTIESLSEKSVGFLAEEEEGFQAGPKGGVKPGMTIQLELSEPLLSCRVTYVETGRVGANFIDLKADQRETIKRYAF